jgi:hypothetical protein
MTKDEVMDAIQAEVDKRSKMATEAKTRADGMFNAGAVKALMEVSKLVARIS